VSDQTLYNLLQWIERWGVWLSWLAWFTVFAGAIAMGWILRHERSAAAWRAAAVVAALALTAHVTDYLVTLYRSPDLALEANPLWRNVVEHYGLVVAKWYGLTGKILVSIIAGQMTAYYIAQRHRLYPVQAGSFVGFVRGLGSRSRTWQDRLAVLFTLFCFFFAGLSFFYFYVAFENWTIDPAVLDRLPSVPLAVFGYVLVLCAAFLWLTFRSFRAESSIAAAAEGGQR
jgi:hypothetical protein